eukprot:6815318-Prymnesium_polylepis.1
MAVSGVRTGAEHPASAEKEEERRRKKKVTGGEMESATAMKEAEEARDQHHIPRYGSGGR